MQVKNENSQSPDKNRDCEPNDRGYHFISTGQKRPSLALMEENLRVRLERFSFSAHTPLEQLREGGYKLNAHNTESITNHLELTILDLRYLINDLHWLQWIKARKGMV